jgi:hypothetical protein
MNTAEPVEIRDNLALSYVEDHQLIGIHVGDVQSAL